MALAEAARGRVEGRLRRTVSRTDTLAYTYEIRELVPAERLVMSTEEGPFPMETTYTWSDAGPEATRMTLRNRGEPTGFAKVAGPIMATAMRRANRKDLARLKAILEREPEGEYAVRIDVQPAASLLQTLPG